MKALDTNVLVRFLVRDDERQAGIIYRIFKQAESDKEIFFIPLLVDLKERSYSVFEALAHSDEEFASYNKWIYHQISFANLRIPVGRERELSISPLMTS